ncbi:SRPBCC family protein [Sphingomonas sp. Ant20]|jgi:hypothetical protein|uniref:SRPBCC family protein n=1 Tax=Sphingomonas sp. Ant20 TaxID=104605 RepID=UPI0009FF051B|nr:SRPBCC family protein [Sphingomonas sp. Ant20]
MVSVENSIELAASPWQVWATLTKLDAYARWHPFVTAAGTPEVGQMVDYSIRNRAFRRRITSTATVTCLSEPDAFGWTIGIKGLLRFDEIFYIEASEHGATLRHIMESRGLLKRIIPGVNRQLRDFIVSTDQALDRYLRGAGRPPRPASNRGKRRAAASRARHATHLRKRDT